MQSEKPFSFLAWFVCLVACVVAMFYMPWVLCQLWAWFVVPTFGLPALTIPLAMGLTLIGMMLTRSYDVKRIDTPDNMYLLALQAVMAPAAFHGVGWIIAQFL